MGIELSPIHAPVGLLVTVRYTDGSSMTRDVLLKRWSKGIAPLSRNRLICMSYERIISRPTQLYSITFGGGGGGYVRNCYSLHILYCIFYIIQIKCSFPKLDIIIHRKEIFQWRER